MLFDDRGSFVGQLIEASLLVVSLLLNVPATGRVCLGNGTSAEVRQGERR